MNYTVYKALNNLAGANTTFTATIAQVGTAINAVDNTFNGTSIPSIWGYISGMNGWYCNETHQSDGQYATTYNGLALTTNVTFVQTNQWKYINANTRVMVEPPLAMNGDITVQGSQGGTVPKE